MKNAEQKLIENEAFNILILFYFYTIYFLVNIFQKYTYTLHPTQIFVYTLCQADNHRARASVFKGVSHSPIAGKEDVTIDSPFKARRISDGGD